MREAGRAYVRARAGMEYGAEHSGIRAMEQGGGRSERVSNGGNGDVCGGGGGSMSSAESGSTTSSDDSGNESENESNYCGPCNGIDIDGNTDDEAMARQGDVGPRGDGGGGVKVVRSPGTMPHGRRDAAACAERDAARAHTGVGRLALAFADIDPRALPLIVDGSYCRPHHAIGLVDAARSRRESDASTLSAPKSYVRLTQMLIERCLLHYLSEAECIVALKTQANVEPGMTHLVFGTLEMQNCAFFAQYWHRVYLRQRVTGPPVRPWHARVERSASGGGGGGGGDKNEALPPERQPPGREREETVGVQQARPPSHDGGAAA